MFKEDHPDFFSPGNPVSLSLLLPDWPNITFEKSQKQTCFLKHTHDLPLLSLFSL